MAKRGVLYVPVADLKEVIEVIRIGLNEALDLSAPVEKGLERWCDEQEVNLARLHEHTDTHTGQ